MQIDWFTFGAQIINFLILVGLLKRLLYGPIIHAMDEREGRISSRLKEARAKQEEAEKEAQKYRTLQDELDRQRREQLAEAEREAEERRQQLIRTAREEVEHLEREWRGALERERETFLHELSERALRETIAVARDALDDLADADLEHQTVEVFIERLQTLGEEQKQDLSEALQAADGVAILHSAFELVPTHRERIRALLEEHVGKVTDLSTEVDASLGFGIELRIEELKVAWSLDSYLDDLTDRVRERLDAELRKRKAQEEVVLMSEEDSAPEK